MESSRSGALFRRLGLLGAAGALTAATLTGCRERPRAVGLVRIVLAGAPWTFDPQRVSDERTRNVLGHFYEPLVDFDANLSLRPRLALSWSNPSDTEWRFVLRDGVVFHDGRLFGAEDVKATLDRARRLVEGFVTESDIHDISAVRILDARTVSVTTRRPRPLLLTRLTRLLILPRDTEDSEVFEPVGTGPWVFEGGSTGPSGEPIRGRRFERYWGDVPEAAEMRIEAEPDETGREEALLSGADVVAPFPRSALDASGRSRGPFRVVRRPTLTTVFLSLRVAPGFRGTQSPFRDVRLRRAVSLALDRERLVREALDGDGTPLWQLAPPGIVGYAERISGGGPDVEEARRLVAEAGFPGGLSSRIHADPTRERVAREVARQLEPAGIRLEVVVESWDDLFRSQLFGLSPVALWSAVHTAGHASGFYESYLHSTGATAAFGGENSSRYADPEVDVLIERASEALLRDDRERLLAAVRDRALSDLPYVPLFSPVRAYGVRDGVEFAPRLDEAVFASEVRGKAR
jgi:peptide/nickel transport system substrate-binding protein